MILVLISCKKKQETTQPAIENITESVYASGIVKTRNQYQVFSSVNGLIKKVWVTEGDLVKKGDPLFSIVNEMAQLNTESAKLQADYSAVNANIEKLNDQKISIDLAKTKMENDASLFERQKNLWQQQIGTKNDLDLKELNYKNSAAAYQSATLRLIELQKQLKFSEEQSRKSLQITNTVSGDYIVKAVVDGRVFDVVKKEGEMINTQTPVAILGDARKFYIELQVDEYDIARMILGQTVVLNMDSYKGKTFEAKINKINPLMNERSRSFTVEADFITQPTTLYPNLTVEANVVIQTKEKVLTIPRAYLSEDSYVWISAKEKKKVTVGLKDYNKAEILSGLKAGDTIYKPVQ